MKTMLSVGILNLGWTLLHFLWQGALVGSALALIQFLWPKNRATQRYAINCAGLLLMAVLPVMTFAWLWTLAVPAPSPVFLPPNEVVVRSGAIAAAPAVTLAFPPPVSGSRRGDWRHALELVLPWLVIVWVGGVGILTLRLLLGWRQLNRLKRTQFAALPPIWMVRLKDLQRRLAVSRPVQLLQSGLIEVPTVIGWLRPVILLPLGTLTGLSCGQLESILAHELAHIRRQDYLVNWLQCLVETMLFYHPAVWWLSRCIREEREHCCDDMAVQICGNPRDYARALVVLEEMRQSPMLLAPAINSGSLVKRIRRLLAPPAPDHAAAGWVSGLVTLLVTISLVYCWHQRAQAAAPNQEMATKNGPATSTTVQSSDELFTRFYDLDWVVLRSQLEKALGQTKIDLPPDELLQRYLATQYITVKQSEVTRLRSADQSRGSILLVATRRELDAFEQSLRDNGAVAGTIPAWARTAEIGPMRTATAQSSDELLTRFYDLDWVLLRSQLEKALGQTKTGFPANELLQRFLAAQGITLKPPKQMRMSPADQSRGYLLLRATRRELDAFEQSLRDNGAAAGTILTWARIAEISPLPTATDTNSPLFSRVFRVDPDTFISTLANLKGAPDLPDTDLSRTIKYNAVDRPQHALHGLLAEVCGLSFIDWEPQGNPNQTASTHFSTAFFNTRTGMIYARASQAGLDAIESLVSVMNTAPPQVTIEARFVELPSAAYEQETSLLPKLPSAVKAELTPGRANFGSAISNTPTANGLRSEFVTQIPGRLTHILAPPQYQSLLKRLEQQPGVELMTAPRVTTLSGRQAQIQVTTQRAVVQPKDASHPEAATITVPTGPCLDVIPQVTVDGYAIRLTVIPSLLIFDGYEAPADNPSSATPRFRLFQAASTVTIWDGQTVVLGDFSPIPSDNTSHPNGPDHKPLLVLVTATLFDPAGNRLHSAADFPFDITKPPIEPKVH